jgi:hypothetical protein
MICPTLLTFHAKMSYSGYFPICKTKTIKKTDCIVRGSFLDGLSFLKIEKRFKRQNNPFIRFTQSLSLSVGTRTVCANVLNMQAISRISCHSVKKRFPNEQCSSTGQTAISTGIRSLQGIIGSMILVSCGRTWYDFGATGDCKRVLISCLKIIFISDATRFGLLLIPT